VKLVAASITTRISKAEAENNSLGLFIQDNCFETRYRSDRLYRPEFYKRYLRYCENNNLVAIHNKNLTQAMRQLRHPITKITGNWYFNYLQWRDVIVKEIPTL
jgi:uncharacterized protein (DUF1786 family)